MAFALNRIRIELIFKRVLPGMLFVKCRDRYDNRSGNAVLTTKINKSRRAVSCESNGGYRFRIQRLLHLSAVSRLQPSLLGLRLMRLRAF